MNECFKFCIVYQFNSECQDKMKHNKYFFSLPRCKQSKSIHDSKGLKVLYKYISKKLTKNYCKQQHVYL